MTFKECRKYGREEIIKRHTNYGFMYKDKNGDYTFSFIYYNTNPPVYVLERSGVVDKVDRNGKWVWDYQRRGFRPKNEKGWNKKEKSILQKLIKRDKKDEVILGIRNCTE